MKNMNRKVLTASMILAFSAPLIATADMHSAPPEDDDRAMEDMNAAPPAEDDGRSMGEMMEDTGDYVSDSALTARVNSAFVVDSELSALEIGVETTDGVVTLTGEVESDAHKSLAEEVTMDIDGVEAVHNEIEVTGS